MRHRTLLLLPFQAAKTREPPASSNERIKAGRATQGAPRTSRRLREGPPTGKTSSCCCCWSSSRGWNRTLPDRETQWPWRTEQRQNLSNPRKTIVLDKVLWFSTNFYTSVSTMRHRTLLLLLLLLLLFLPRLKKRTLPDRETQWPWRTEQRQNRAQKLPNVPSETLEKQ